MAAVSDEGKTAVITGSNSGIGFETARVLGRNGWRIVITGRDREKLERAADALTRETGAEIAVRIGDFTSLASVRVLATQLLAERKIDVLLNNVGIAVSKRRLTEDGNEMTLQVNHLAPFLLTNLLLDKLKANAPSRIVNVASGAHYHAPDFGFDDFQFERAHNVRIAYARTKLYNILFTRELARRLAGTGVTANALHPGRIRTSIGHEGDLTGIARLGWAVLQRLTAEPAEAGSEVAVFVATAPELATVSGKYFGRDRRERTPSSLALDDNAAGKLWEMSCERVGLPAGAAVSLS